MIVYSATISLAQSWKPLPGGSLNGWVVSITNFGGYVWIGGNFTMAGPVSTDHIVRHDGNQWVFTQGLPSAPNAFCEYNGELFAFGAFAIGSIRYGAMKWNGSAWIPLCEIDNFGKINTAVVYGGTLIIGGSFYTIDGMPITSLAKWDGTTWSAFSGTTTCFWTWPPRVYGLHVTNGCLYVAGSFDQLCGVSSDCAAKWDGSVWTGMSIGWNTSAIGFAHNSSGLYVTGTFLSAGGAVSPRVAKESVSGWTAVGNGVQLTPRAAETYLNRIYLAGGAAVASGDYISNCGYWDGIRWVGDFSGISSGLVFDLHTDVSSGILYAGGTFSASSGSVADYIAYKGEISLPVELTSFTCDVERNGVDNTIAISWTTASETNADYFTLSVSTDAIMYLDIENVDAHGTTTTYHHYESIYIPQKSGLYYFRLKQYDWDGTCSGIWDDVIRIRSPIHISYSIVDNSINCIDCDDVVCVYSLSGTTIFCEYPPIDMSKHPPGLYIAQHNDSELYLRFVKP